MLQRLLDLFFYTETLEDLETDHSRDITVTHRDGSKVHLREDKTGITYGYIRVVRPGLFHYKIVICNLEDTKEVIYRVQDMTFISQESKERLLECLKYIYFIYSGKEFDRRYQVEN